MKLGTLGGGAGIVVLIASIPLAFVIYSSGQLSAQRWAGLWTGRLPELLANTLSLAVLVAMGSFILGVSSAWLIARREFVGRNIAGWLLILPLTIPTYVSAHIYTTLLEEEGWLGQLWKKIFGQDSVVPDLYNVGGVALVLSLTGFSYVFLLVRAALTRSSKNLEDAARIHGQTAFGVFNNITLPLMRPAIVAGLAVVVLHVLSDFGAVSMLRFQTFTLSIYSQMSGRFDHQAAAGLSLVLVCLSLTFLILERVFRSRQRFYASGQARLVEAKPATATEQVFIWLWLGLIVAVSVGLPLAWMVVWSWDAWLKGLIDGEFWQYARNSGIASFAAATLTVCIAFPIALYQARRHSLASNSFVQLSNVGFVLPGPVVALGVTTFMLATLPFAYGTLAALFMALMIRFLPLAVHSQEAAMQQLTPSIEQAGRVLGAGPFENLWRVTLPMIRGGMISAWVLVFIDVLKELPATLLLRPIGFDTLPVRIWIEASEEMLELAAPAALTLVIGTLPALWIMMRGEIVDSPRSD